MRELSFFSHPDLFKLHFQSKVRFVVILSVFQLAHEFDLVYHVLDRFPFLTKLVEIRANHPEFFGRILFARRCLLPASFVIWVAVILFYVDHVWRRQLINLVLVD